ncbi:hypothetical protein [Kribbella sp.]|uniref:hypothetical protein n=1 Tax=Kribbella sp. TaxID=1871183 RepID=UPI002D6DA15B|nr:hypothetical protein [Kribbella sp.]HZX06430.1 hypothetical protein [Kribbella sp.]
MVYLAELKVLPGLGTPRWTPGQALGYEIAQEGVRQAVGYYAHLIAEAEAAGEPDAVAALRAEQAAWAARGQQLDPLAVRAVKRVRDDADELLSVDEDDEQDASGG